jgi:hypothetical protein
LNGKAHAGLDLRLVARLVRPRRQDADAVMRRHRAVGSAMKTPYRPTAEELAVLVTILIQRYAKERGRDVSRFRLSRNSLRRLAIRDQLRDALVEDWVDVMAMEYGWLVFRHADEFLLQKAENTRTWTKISSKRCDDVIRRLRTCDRSAIDDAEQEIDQTRNEDEGEDDEV